MSNAGQPEDQVAPRTEVPMIDDVFLSLAEAHWQQVLAGGVARLGLAMSGAD